MANTADTIYSLIRESVKGVTPSPTPAFKPLECLDANFELSSNSLTSEVIRQNRAAGDKIEQGFFVTGNFSADFRRDSTLDEILQGGLGGTFDGNVLKAGSTDHSFTFEQRMLNDAGTPLYFRYTGVQVSSLEVAIDATAKATITGELIGRAQTNSETSLVGATYTPPVAGPSFSGGGAGNITIAGLTGAYYSLNLKVSHNRSAKHRLFSPNAYAISTSGNREVVLTLTLYRDDFTPETVFVPNTVIPVSFTLGTGANAYTFSCARMTATRPKRSQNDGSELVTVELTAGGDATTGTDLTVTKS